jgi:hypothetical protein
MRVRSLKILSGSWEQGLISPERRSPSALTYPRDVRKVMKRLRSGKTPGFDGVPNIILKNMPLRRTFIWIMCSNLVLSYVIFLKYGSTLLWFLFQSLARITSILQTTFYWARLAKFSRGPFWNVSQVIIFPTISLDSGWPTLPPTSLEGWYDM